MKFRNSFVSNSSSSSFVVLKKDLTQKQIDAIMNHIEYFNTNIKPHMDADEAKCWFAKPENTWHVFESDSHIDGNTTMDNFPMQDFFGYIGIHNVNFRE